jgi:hypothetical protein
MSHSELRIWHHARRAGMLAFLALAAACADLLGFEPNVFAPGDRADGGSGGGAGPEEPASAGAPSDGGAGGDGSLGGLAIGGRSATSEWPLEGDPCSVRDAFACPEPAANWRLKCSAATWQWEFYDECQPTQRCNRERNTCETLTCDPDDPSSLLDCVSPSVAARCGPDYVTLEFEPCDFQCVEDQGCVEPDGDEQVYVDRPRHGVVGGNLWPGSPGTSPSRCA